MARSERSALCDLLTELGEQAPTLCEGWTTRDLAVHLVVRERRPWSAVAGGGGARARVERLPFAELVAALRQPPRWSLGGFSVVDRIVNTLELFIHHEDVRRAQPQWRPRTLSRPQQAALWRGLKPMAKLGLRRFPATVLVEAPEHGRLRSGRGGPGLRVVGAPSELALFVSGRQRVAREVRLIGPDALAERLSGARLDW
ncbi:TIGR03085 family protein [Thermobifida halotolerans]|uniref:TIGR03085 family protein n=1 Tax=Thermobifida halotolerans TaxID=483545 RepID=A0A399G5W8_9ACTN|nr:TIGR03085 family protein [Thermobifida halotolerans]